MSAFKTDVLRKCVIRYLWKSLVFLFIIFKNSFLTEQQALRIDSAISSGNYFKPLCFMHLPRPPFEGELSI